MTGSFSPFVIEALVQAISGGPGLGNTDPAIGLYRSGPEIEGFLMSCGIDPARGSGSRLPMLRGCLKWAAVQPSGRMSRRLERAIPHPR